MTEVPTLAGYFEICSVSGCVAPPLQLEPGKTKPISLADLDIEPLPSNFASLGFDVVSRLA